MKNALPEQLGQHKQIGPENPSSHELRDLILKEDNISSLVLLNQHNYAEAFANSPPAHLCPNPRYCSIGNNLISGGRRAGGERGRPRLPSGGCAPSKEPFWEAGAQGKGKMAAPHLYISTASCKQCTLSASNEPICPQLEGASTGREAFDVIHWKLDAVAERLSVAD